MLHIDLIESTILHEPLKRLISAMLPTENYDSVYFVETLKSLERYIQLDELSAEYYVMINIFKQLEKLVTGNLEYSPIVTRESVEIILQSNAMALVRNPMVNFGQVLAIEGYETNLEIKTNATAGAKLLFKRTLELYDTCFEMAQPSCEAISFIPALKEALMLNVAEQSIRAQAKIINSEIRVGRTLYSGVQGWFEYIKVIDIELGARLEDGDDTLVRVDSLDKGLAMLSSLSEMFQPLAKYGLPPMDTATPMLRHRLVIICANENVGKTKFAVNCIGKLLAEGKKVLMMCGENHVNLAWAQILSNYIYQKHGIYITDGKLADMSTLSEDNQKLVVACAAEISENGNLILKDSFTYDKFYSELVAEYERSKFDAVFIDHTMALVGKGDQYTNLGDLAVQARRFKKDYPCYLQILSHLSVIAKEALSKGKKIESSPTKGNGTLSAEADEIFILIDNEKLASEGLLGIYNYKRRNAPRVLEDMIVKKKFNISSFEWDDKFQGSVTGLDIEAEKAMEAINDYYDEENLEVEEDEELDITSEQHNNSFFGNEEVSIDITES